MKKVLVIENDSDTLDLLGYIIADMDLDVQSRRHPVSMGEILNIDPDIILIDHWLPFTKANDTCLEIKSNENTRHMVVILMSTDSRTEEIAKASHADGYIEKPFDIDYLRKVLKQFADTPLGT